MDIEYYLHVSIKIKQIFKIVNLMILLSQEAIV